MYRIGLWATAFYFSGLFAFAFYRWDLFKNLGLNEWGDFFAGFVGPVALLWIVLSFLLQSKELSASVKALELQAEEMKNSVAQQKKMVQATYATLEHERTVVEKRELQRKAAAQPKFLVTLGASTGRGHKLFKHKLTILNTGNSCTGFLLILFQDGNTLFDATSEHLINGASVSRQDNIYQPRWEGGLTADISYTDIDGENHTKNFELRVLETENGWPKYSVVELS
ncbi:hypothetical protein [Pseudophaeobacter sp.]|uniref:hypothetical protein n=1 Tax=Pseudophaeobacter sp. TaxID=1971739 RepID=UPI0032983543